MASRYLVATGNWSSTSVWSATSGGASGASVPTSSDNVYLDANSSGFTVTLIAEASCNNLDASGITSSTTMDAGSYPTQAHFNIYGNLTLGAYLHTSVDYTNYGRIQMLGTGKTLTYNGCADNWLGITVNTGASVTLQDTFTSGYLSVSGTFNSGSNTLNITGNDEDGTSLYDSGTTSNYGTSIITCAVKASIGGSSFANATINITTSGAANTIVIYSSSSVGNVNIDVSNTSTTAGYDSIDMGSASLKSLFINLGVGVSNAQTFHVIGSPTLRSLIIQSQNSAAHTVTFDNAPITVTKLVLVGSSSSNKLSLVGNTSGTTIGFTSNGTCYGQYVSMDSHMYYSYSGSMPLYIGSGSTTAFYGWLIQDPPKISTLVDPLTTAPGSNTNWTVTGTVTQKTTGYGGGGYNVANAGITSTGTFDLTDSSIIIEYESSTSGPPGAFDINIGSRPGLIDINDKGGNIIVDVGTTVGGYPWGPDRFNKLTIDLGSNLVQSTSPDAVTWTIHTIKTLSSTEMLYFKSMRISAAAGSGYSYATVDSINPVLPIKNPGAFLQFF